MTNHPLSGAARHSADGLLEVVDGARCALVATADGFALAHAARGSSDADRLAAMVSSMGALAEAASRESGIGTPRCLVVESTEGRLVVRCFQAGSHPLVLAVLTDARVALGMVWSQLVQAERSLVAAAS